MKRNLFNIAFIFMFILISGTATASNTEGTSSAKTIYIAEPDGSTSCNKDEGKTLGDSVNEAEAYGYKVISAFKGASRGFLMCMACGCPSGIYNVVEVVESEKENTMPTHWSTFEKGSIEKADLFKF